jgi:predicted AlkP superfamily pyrophosphatase or phosphodiesterase
MALCAGGLSILISCQHAHGGPIASKKLIVLGVDGLDPDLLTKFMAEGKMPNFARLAEQGIVPSFDDQHSAAKSGGLVEPDHGNECRRARDL